MASNDRFLVTITYKDKTYSSTTAFDTETNIILINNKLMRIERIPNNRVFQIFKEQKNAKATYCLYLELPDPVIPQGAEVTWSMQGYSFTGKVKFTQPYARVVLGAKAECYIQSDNE